jgi:enamine deaminase RidA (YjgF/YER057c/UK114 family)
MPRKQVIQPEALAAPVGVFSAAVEGEGRRMLFISGMTARDNTGDIVGPGDYEIQTRQVCENLKAAVEAAGGTLDDLMRVDVHVMDVAAFDIIHKVRAEYFPSNPPASTMVQVAALIDPRMVIEISAIALLD